MVRADDKPYNLSSVSSTVFRRSAVDYTFLFNEKSAYWNKFFFKYRYPIHHDCKSSAMRLEVEKMTE